MRFIEKNAELSAAMAFLLIQNFAVRKISTNFGLILLNQSFELKNGCRRWMRPSIIRFSYIQYVS